MKESTPKTIHLKDYQAPNYLVSEINLDFKIYDGYTRVINEAKYYSNSAVQEPGSLVLAGMNMKLIQVSVDGQLLASTDYTQTEDSLILVDLPEKFTLTIETEIVPEENKSCEGLYQSGDIFCTQNEPEGFRRITYFLDRSDVMTVYTTRVEADKKRFPILLSNGNCTGRGELEGGRHFTVWNDPFVKPSYLFALVAGDFAMLSDTFTTMTGREIVLEIYVDRGNEDQAQFSLDSLKKSMKWDEDRFGLEYDLDIYMIVAVDAFNMGAMENKGLNIFNTSCALANPKTATDSNFVAVEAVVAHEYFHNWTGNRVTCRDWFQLTLKEGLTVFRDQEFSADVTSRAVRRIEEVGVVRNHQFVEDGGPTAHPIKPASYIEINNFYTTTIYRKGAEVIRMIETFIGRENFRKGMDLYFERHDGQAVTTEDFVAAMSDASGFDLTQFRETWYAQAGTPDVDVETSFDAVAQTYTISVKQTCRETAETEAKKAYHFPIILGLLDSNGDDMPLILADGTEVTYLDVRESEQEFVFTGIKEKPVPSLLRNFSAPVKLSYDYSIEELSFLLANDNDEFNRYEAGQRLAIMELERIMDWTLAGEEIELDERVLAAYQAVVAATDLDDAIKAETLRLPLLTALIERMDIVDYETAYEAREFMTKAIAQGNESALKDIYEARFSSERAYGLSPEEMGARSLQNTALGFLNTLEEEDYTSIASAQFKAANNMTDEIAALSVLAQYDTEEREEAVETFYKKWNEDALVMNKWFAVQASAKVATLESIKELMENPSYDKANPNKIRSVIGAFVGNVLVFHAEDGSGYEFMADQILEIDSFNSNVAGGLALAFKKYAKLDSKRKAKVKVQLERILAKDGLSKDVFEIISKTLKNA